MVHCGNRHGNAGVGDAALPVINGQSDAVLPRCHGGVCQGCHTRVHLRKRTLNRDDVSAGTRNTAANIGHAGR